MELTKLITRLVSVQKCTERTKTVRNDSGADLLVLRVATPDDTFQGRSQSLPPRWGRFFVQIASEPAGHADIVLSQ
jgi:hypothetical protein